MEVTRYNFEKVLDGFEDKLKSTSFIAIDLELSGLESSPDFSSSLFDYGSDRYTKIRKRTAGIIATQVGLSLFRHDRSSNSYISSTYTFHLTPQSIGNVKQFCTFEGGVLGFLKNHKFDFNQFAYEGIPYLNKAEGLIIKKEISENNLDDHINMAEAEKLTEYFSNINDWKKTTNETLSLSELDSNSKFIFMHKFHQKYPDLILYIDSSGMIIKRKEDDKKLIKTSENIEEISFRYANGFTNIVELMAKYKLPLILHNGFTDLLIIYKQFINIPPTNYDSFKKHLHELFPKIYDTKFIFNSIRSKVRKEKVGENSSLENLYTFFLDSSKAAILALYPPKVSFENDFDATPWYHHAGWDAYCTGFCFIRISHCVACDKIGTSRVLSKTEHEAAIDLYTNKLYLSRGAQPYLCLDKNDPTPHRPTFLYIETVKKKSINLSEIVKLISVFESADVKKYGKKSALVAVTNKYGIKRIMDCFNSNEDFKIARFNLIKHSPVIRLALWSSFIISSGSLMAFVLYKMK